MIDRFREIDDDVKKSISRLSSPLRQGFCVLAIAQSDFGVEYLSAEEIVEALDRIGVSVYQANLLRAFARAGSRIRLKSEEGVTKYKVMLSGREEIESLITIPGPSVIYVEGGKPLSAKRKIAEIFSELNGIVRISDPYYGIRSLDVLSKIPSACDVRFLTARTGSREDVGVLQRTIGDYKREKPYIEIRLYPNPAELHDRYLIANDSLWILGHGIKDIGNKESFIIRIDQNLNPDLISTVETFFDQRWAGANPI